MYKTEQEQFWAGDFGNEYASRNQDAHDIACNMAQFSKIFGKGVLKEQAGSLIEFGSNVGMNLMAIERLFPDMKLGAIEINEKAVEQLKKNVTRELKVYQDSILECQIEEKWDVALIKGVLIHINPDELDKVYQKLYDCANHYIILCEYYNPTPVEVNYRGNKDRLFKRDFAGEMLDKFPDLELVNYGFSYHRDPFFPQDDGTWFLLRKHS